MIRALTPKSWSYEDTEEVCALAAELLCSPGGRTEWSEVELAPIRGIYDDRAKKRALRLYARAEKVAQAHVAGRRWQMVVDAIDDCVHVQRSEVPR